MRRLVTVLAISTALLGGACAYLLWRAADQRTQASAASHDGSALQQQIDTLVAERDRLRSEIELARRSAPGVPPPQPGATPVHAGNVAGGAAVSSASARGGPGAGLFDRMAPAQRLTMVRQRYGRLLYQELGLSDAQVDALLPVLSRQDEGPGGPAAGFGPRDTPEAREREREVAAVIGAEKAAQFAEARSTIPARTEVRTIRDELERTGAPLSDAQNTALLAALKDIRWPKPPSSAPGEAPQLSIEHFRAMRSERAKYVRDLAAPLLTPRQLQRMDENESLRAALQAAPPGPFPLTRPQ